MKQQKPQKKQENNFMGNLQEIHRHRCAVRQLCKFRKQMGLTKFRTYISEKPNLHQYFADYQNQYAKGNRGEWGTWK